MSDPAIDRWLEAFLNKHGAVSGTVHYVADDELRLAAAVRIPDPVRAMVERVPRGKGMAGLALERVEPVTTCNLKTDATGDVRPGARAVDATGAAAIPVIDAHGGVRAVVGLAFAETREFTVDELGTYLAAVADLPQHVG